jgi:mRNA-degrading endonuclease toxin of MazEF toxin-antitoxin module
VLYSRPVLVLRVFGNGTFMGIPLTSVIKSGTWYASISFHGKEHVALLTQARVLSTKRLENKMGALPEADFEKIKEAFVRLFT